MEFVRELPAGRRVGVLTVPGDRRDEDIRAAGRLAAELDYVILKEDYDLRGRAEGEVTRLLAEGLRDGGLPAESIEQIPDDNDAVLRGLNILREDDLLVIFAEKIDKTLTLVREFAVPT
jgi:cyanophycin synthetase